MRSLGHARHPQGLPPLRIPFRIVRQWVYCLKKGVWVDDEFQFFHQHRYVKAHESKYTISASGRKRPGCCFRIRK